MLSIFDITVFNALLWTFLAWHYALRCGFISDDHAVIANRKDIIPDEERATKEKIETAGPVEPYWIKVFNDGVVMYFLNAIMFRLPIRKNPLPWHALSLTLHLLNVYLLSVFLTPITGEDIAIVAAFIWGINPMLNQVTVWCSGRPYSIATALVLIGMINYQNPFIFLPCYGLAVITNISIAFVPVLLKLIYPEACQTTFYVVAMFGLGFPFILWKFHRRFTAALVIDRDNFRFKKRRFNMLARLYAYYVWALLIPIKMGWYHQAGFRYNIKWEKFNIWTLVGYGVVIALACSGVPGWWFILCVLPNANIFATNSFVQDRYTYFGSIGIALIFAPILAKFPLLLACAGTLYVVRAYMYTRQMKDDEALYRENWRLHPKSDYAVNNLSYFLISQKRYEEARQLILRGIEVDKNNKMLWYNLGVTWAATGDLRSDEGKFRFLRAVDCWKMALQVEPRWKKPADDIKRLITFLLENKVITMDKGEAANGMPMIDVPILGKLGGTK